MIGKLYPGSNRRHRMAAGGHRGTLQSCHVDDWISPVAYVHPTATLERYVRPIGDGDFTGDGEQGYPMHIWGNVSVEAFVRLGVGCYLAPLVRVLAGSTLGHYVVVHEGTVIGAGCTIGAEAVIGRNCSIGHGSTIGIGAVVDGGMFVPPGTTIPDGFRWGRVER